MGMRYAASVAGLMLGLMSGEARASYVFTFSQNTAGVSEVGSGSLDLSGLIFSNNNPDVAATDPSSPRNAIGAPADVSIYETAFNTDSALGTGQTTNATSGTGQFVSFNANLNVHAFEVPVGYQSGAQLGLSTAFFAGSTLSSLGLELGSHTYTYNTSNGRDSFVVNVNLSTVPLPASAPLFGAALVALGAAGYGLKRKSRAAATA